MVTAVPLKVFWNECETRKTVPYLANGASMAELPLKLRDLLGYRRKELIHFSDFWTTRRTCNPSTHLLNYLFCNKIFWTRNCDCSGEPVISYNVFGSFQQWHQCGIWSRILHQTGTGYHWISRQRGWAKSRNYSGGASASGKTNVVDLIIRALEEYTKQVSVRLYTFFSALKTKMEAMCGSSLFFSP